MKSRNGRHVVGGLARLDEVMKRRYVDGGYLPAC